MSCRDEILNVVSQLISTKGINEFTTSEVLHYMMDNGTQFKESTIRTHITSRLCGNAPDNHGTTYNDFERIGVDKYKLLVRG